MNFLKTWKNSPYFWPLVALTLILLYNFIFTKGFFTVEVRDDRLYGTLIDIFHRSIPVMLVGIGITLVIAIGGIDLSVGAVVAVSGAIAASLIGGQLVIHPDGTQDYVSRIPMFMAIAAALASGALCGAWNGLLVSKANIPPIVATLILMVAGRGIAQLITNGEIITVYYAPFFFVGNGYLFKLPFTLFIASSVLLLTLLLTRKTALGLFIESVGINATASRFSGLNSARVQFLVYTFCGFCAAIAGLIVCSNVKSADANNAGLLFELDAILSVVIGGTSLSGGKFYLLGTVVGAIILQTLTTTIYATGVAPEVTLVIKALVVFTISLLQSPSFRTSTVGFFTKNHKKVSV